MYEHVCTHTNRFRIVVVAGSDWTEEKVLQGLKDRTVWLIPTQSGDHEVWYSLPPPMEASKKVAVLTDYKSTFEDRFDKIPDPSTESACTPPTDTASSV